jgi:hypothetical protein
MAGWKKDLQTGGEGREYKKLPASCRQGTKNSIKLRDHATPSDSPKNMKHQTLIIATVLALATGLSARAEIKVTTAHNDNDTAAPGFKFTNVPAPAASNAARQAKITLVDGEADPNSGDLAKLNDGKLPNGEDQPGENFFFNAGSHGGRLQMDLGSVIGIRQINTYSWHAASRGPQVYKLYASDGTAKDFNGAPKNGTDPETCGWKLIATVNTSPKNDDDAGGQYGVAIADPDGVIGKYRYLLFDMASSENHDPFGNTFYSEIDVIDASAPAVAEDTAAPTAPTGRFDIKTADGKCDITINTAAAPELEDWADHTLAPVLAEWYPKIVAILPSDGFTAPAHFTVTFKTMGGVAYTSGTHVVVNKDWIDGELHGEAVGSLVHESVHVVQRSFGNAPSWLIEGTADYIRWFKYEPQSHGADIVWMRRQGKRFSPNYNGSYRISANFLNWVTEKYDQDIVAQLNAAMRNSKYDDSLWKTYTGKPLEELGAEWKKEVETQLAAGEAAKQSN